jgi:putative ABC transport system substrate-binding protein
VKRRTFIAGLGGVVACPLASRAQQPDRAARIGVLLGLPESDPEAQRWRQALLDALRQVGWRDSAKAQIDLRWAADPERMQQAAKELVQSQPDVIHVTTTPATTRVLRETSTIPVVFSVVSDPVGAGFVQSFARPGGNATGFVNIEASLAGKWLELLKKLSLRTSRVAVVFNPKTAPQSDYYLKLLEAAAVASGLALDVVHVSSANDIETTIDKLPHSNAGLVVLPDLFTSSQAQRDLIISLTARHRIPAVYPFAFFVRAGGLISYGVDLPDLERRSAEYIDRILKGARPQDLPVQLPTKFELAINLKNANSIGIVVPPTLFATADEVIE